MQVGHFIQDSITPWTSDYNDYDNHNSWNCDSFINNQRFDWWLRKGIWFANNDCIYDDCSTNTTNNTNATNRGSQKDFKIFTKQDPIFRRKEKVSCRNQRNFQPKILWHITINGFNGSESFRVLLIGFMKVGSSLVWLESLLFILSEIQIGIAIS